MSVDLLCLSLLCFVLLCFGAAAENDQYTNEEINKTNVETSTLQPSFFSDNASEPDTTSTSSTDTHDNIAYGSTTSNFSTNLTSENGTELDTNSTIRNMSSGGKHDPSIMPPIVTDIDEGLVAGMSVLVVCLFGCCGVLAVARRCYRRQMRKNEETVYEEVEDAATSCSIEGSSNVKFLIGRPRGINKSRIEQINEEWNTNTGKPLIKPNFTAPDPEPDVTSVNSGQKDNFSKCSLQSKPRNIIEDEDSEYATAEPDEASLKSEEKPFSKSSTKNKKKNVVADEDSEYATAEPVEDLYSLADGENADHVQDDNPIDIKPAGLVKIKLQRSIAFDNDNDDPYADTQDDEYDNLNVHRDHVSVSVERKEAEDPYELTQDGDYDSLGNTRPHVGESLHRCKWEEKLADNLNNTSLKDSSRGELYDDSFEGEYDLLNTPRFRITISSDNYDNVKLPWEDNSHNNNTSQEHSEFKSLEKSVKANSNLYTDVDSLMQSNEIKTDQRDCARTDQWDGVSSITTPGHVNDMKLVANLINGNFHDDDIQNSCESEVIELTCQNQNVEESLYSLATEITSNESDTLSNIDSTEVVIPNNINNNESTCDNTTLIFQNMCFGIKIENGTIPAHKIHGMVNDDNFNLPQSFNSLQ